MKKLPILLIASLFLTRALAAQDSTRLWTLEECMRYAVENSPQVVRQRYAGDNYRQDQIGAIAALLPRVSAGTGANWSFGRGIDPETNTYVSESSFSNSYSISASMPLFNGLAAINNVRSARIARLRGDQEWERTARQVAEATMTAFFDVIYYEQAVAIASEQLEQSRKNLAMIERQAELGLKGRPEVAQIEAEVAGGEYLLVQQQNRLEISRIGLKDRMNYPLEDALSIDRQVTLHSGLFVDDAGAIYEQALAWIPEAKIAEYTLEESRLDLSIAKGQQYPSLSASGGYSTRFNRRLTGGIYTPFEDQLNNNLGKSIGLSLSIPIFGGLGNRTRISRARNNLRMAEQTNTETLRTLRSEIEQAVMDVEGSARQYAQSLKKVASQQEAHTANQRRFEEGLISALELQASTNLLLQARVEELQVQLQYQIKCRMLDYYKGEALY
jgi:outer membrane protein